MLKKKKISPIQNYSLIFTQISKLHLFGQNNTLHTELCTSVIQKKYVHFPNLKVIIDTLQRTKKQPTNQTKRIYPKLLI